VSIVFIGTELSSGFVGFILEVIDMNKRLNELLDELIGVNKKLGTDPAAKRLAEYNTVRVHKKQMEFHACKKRNRWVFGGNRSGKTECGAVECVWLARGVHPFRENKTVSGWVVSLSFGVQKAVAQKKVLSYLPREWIEDIVMREGRRDVPESGIIDTIFVKNVFGGISSITFKSAEEGREKFQGASLDFVWFDEEPPEDVWRECTMRVMDRKGDIFATSQWVRQDLQTLPKVKFFFGAFLAGQNWAATVILLHACFARQVNAFFAVNL